ncbi:MAG: hypothetical protein ACJ8F7_09510 [Gemmataceae bacterium]
MQRSRLLLTICVVLAWPVLSLGDPPAQPMSAAGPLPAGKWSVEFANGVTERVEAKSDGTVAVSEPARSAGGKATALQGSVLLVYEDDRVERWPPVGRRMVVEHWFPAAQFPNGTPVRGIADHAE